VRQLVRQLDSQLDRQLHNQLDSQLVNQLDSQLVSQSNSQLVRQLVRQLDTCVMTCTSPAELLGKHTSAELEKQIYPRTIEKHARLGLFSPNKIHAYTSLVT
jgi:hypothetical protein